VKKEQEQQWHCATRNLFNASIDLLLDGDEETYEAALDEIIATASSLKRMPHPSEGLKLEFKRENQLNMLEKVAYITLQTDRRSRYLD
jgi:hypothetical protein